jgi:putative transcriptional regulator
MTGVESLRGKLLIAGSSLFDPNFRRTILLVAHHDEEGAMGAILNRPADVTVGEAAPELAALVGSEQRVFVGGPVQPEAAVVLAEFEDPSRAGVIAFDSIGFLAGEDPATVTGIHRGRVFVGHAGWGPGQLEREMEIDSWLTDQARRDDVFTPDPERLWTRVLRRKGRDYEILATMPFDPSAN